MTTLWFVVPAYRRFALAEICFAQHAWVHEQLLEHGIEASSVVIADDENLELARAHGFATVEMPNWAVDGAVDSFRPRQSQLGSKMNAGYRFAASEGIEYVMALDNDSWIAADRFAPLPEWGEMVCGRNYAAVSPDGSAQIRCVIDGGLASQLMQTRMLAACDWAPVPTERGYNPAEETLRSVRRSLGYVDIVWRDRHPFDHVGFLSDQQLTPWGALHSGRTQVEWPPYEGLEEHFPQEFVERIAAYHEESISSA